MTFPAREHSLLYISATVAEDHPLHSVFRTRFDTPPDLDLRRIIDSSGSWIRRCFAPAVVDATRGAEALPRDLSPYDGIVIGGSLYSCVGDDSVLESWQLGLIALIRRAIHEEGLAYLGLCGGGQLGLRALGGTVLPNRAGLAGPGAPEGTWLIRTSVATLTDVGRSDPIFDGCPSELPMQESHSDWLATLPDSAEELAATEDLENLVVAVGPRVRLFLTHPELTLDYLRRILAGVRGRASDDLGARIERASAALKPTEAANRRIVHNFVRHICPLARC